MQCCTGHPYTGESPRQFFPEKSTHWNLKSLFKESGLGFLKLKRFRAFTLSKAVKAAKAGLVILLMQWVSVIIVKRSWSVQPNVLKIKESVRIGRGVVINKVNTRRRAAGLTVGGASPVSTKCQVNDNVVLLEM